jgi:hypothetical protein
VKLSKKEITEQKRLHGAKAVNFFMRFNEAQKKWRSLPNNFILEVLKNSDDLPINGVNETRVNRSFRRKVRNQFRVGTSKDGRGTKNNA